MLDSIISINFSVAKLVIVFWGSTMPSPRVGIFSLIGISISSPFSSSYFANSFVMYDIPIPIFAKSFTRL